MKIRANNKDSADIVEQILTGEKVDHRRVSNLEISTARSVSEESMRIMLQEQLDKAGFNYQENFVAVNGNSVWSMDAVMEDARSMDEYGMSKYMYSFLLANCSLDSRQHPTSLADLSKLASEVRPPKWKTDVIKILDNLKEK